jgi:hypothetical protein
MKIYLCNPGMTATLKTPYLGYTRIEIIKNFGFQWLVKIVDSGKEILVYGDEFILDENNYETEL